MLAIDILPGRFGRQGYRGDQTVCFFPGHHRRLEESLKGLEIVECSHLCSSLRYVKPRIASVQRAAALVMRFGGRSDCKGLGCDLSLPSGRTQQPSHFHSLVVRALPSQPKAKYSYRAHTNSFHANHSRILPRYKSTCADVQDKFSKNLV